VERELVEARVAGESAGVGFYREDSDGMAVRHLDSDLQVHGYGAVRRRSGKRCWVASLEDPGLAGLKKKGPGRKDGLGLRAASLHLPFFYTKQFSAFISWLL
jgi:hypothetical protein